MYKVYWIKYPDYKDPNSEGYIGITSQTIDERFQEHKSNIKNKLLANRCKKEKVEIVCLHDSLDEEQAKLIEEQYRPSDNIGWNLVKGGGLPPSRKGKVSPKVLLKGDERTEKQKEGAKKRSEKIKGNNFSGQRKNRVVHKKICECCNKEFTFKDNSRPRKYCSIKCSVQKRNENLEYREKLRVATASRWSNDEYKNKVSGLIRKALND